MEPLVRYIHNEEEVLKTIINSNDYDFISDTYRLFLNYGLSLRTFFKLLLESEFSATAIDVVLREDNVRTHLLTNFCVNYGGKFSFIVREIQKISNEFKPNSNKRNLRKAVAAFVKFLEEHLNHIVSDPLIDICSEICSRVNAIHRESGPKVVLSFLFFRIFSPLVYEQSKPVDDHLRILIQAINRLAVGQNEEPKFRKSFFIKISDALLNLVGQILRSHRPTDYWAVSPLPPVEFYAAKTRFLAKMGDYQTYEQNARKIGRALTWQKIYYGVRQDGSKPSPTQRKKKDLITTVSQSLNSLVTRAQVAKSLESLERDIRFIALWSSEDIISLVISQRLDPSFFEEWKIDGTSFLQCNEDTLIAMECPDLAAVCELVEEIRELAITDPHLISTRHLSKWSLDEVCLYANLTGMTNIIPHLIERNIDGYNLTRLNVTDFRQIPGIQPKMVRRLRNFQNQYVNGDPEKSYHLTSLIIAENAISESAILSLTEDTTSE